MGWTFVRQSRSALIRELIEPHQTAHNRATVIAHALVGNVLWSVVETVPTPDGAIADPASASPARVIHCHLLAYDGGDWGYKPMIEAMHPYVYSCPPAYLDMAPEQCRAWREGVHAFHSRRRVPTAARA